MFEKTHYNGGFKELTFRLVINVMCVGLFGLIITAFVEGLLQTFLSAVLYFRVPSITVFWSHEIANKFSWITVGWLIILMSGVFK